MNTPFELKPATLADLPVVRNLSMFYVYDMAEFLGWPPDERGLFRGCEEFFADWEAGKNHPYLVRCGGELAGFAGVKALDGGHGSQARDGEKRGGVDASPAGGGGQALADGQGISEGPGHCIQEFFILRKFRRQGMGRQVACALLDAFPGNWKVQALTQNTPAVAFWQATIRAHTRAQFREHDKETSPWGPLRTFLFRTGG